MDGELRAHLAAGELDRAFAVVYAAYRADIAAFVVARAPRLAEDICQDTWAAVRTALAKLDADDRDLLALRYVDDLKPGEIAVVLGGDVAANTISQRLVRIVRRLREDLRAHPAFTS